MSRMVFFSGFFFLMARSPVGSRTLIFDTSVSLFFLPFLQIDCQDWKSQVSRLADLFSLAWQEQQRTDRLLRHCLPQLKDHFLLLSSYDQNLARRQKFRVRSDSQP